MSMETIVHVHGMTCGHCVSSVTEEIMALDNVQSVQVDLDTGRVVIQSLSPLLETEISRAINEAGYSLVDQS